MDNNYMNDFNNNIEPKVQKEKKNRFSKFMKLVACAVCFGFIAGGIMFGVQWAGGRLVNSGEPAVDITTTNTDTKPNVSVTSSTDADRNTGGSVVVTDVSSVVEEVMPSIVAITSTQIVNPGYSFWFGQGESYKQEGAGSGIIIGKSDKELLIVTNNHVVSDADELSVQFINEKSVEAYVKGTDSKNDLAVVSIPLDEIEAETMSQIKIATMGDSDKMVVGEGAIAIGNALGYGQSVTTGVISALDREVKVDNSSKNLIQTDAAINPGNSGGALLNMNGELIGINVAKYSSNSVEGMGFAIPISSAKDIINNLMNKETRVKVDEEKRGYIGINATDVDETSSELYDIPMGVYIYSAVEDGPADKAGLAKGDVITAIDGQEVTTLAELKENLEYYAIGEEVTLTVQIQKDNSYKEEEVKVVLGKKTESSEEGLSK